MAATYAKPVKIPRWADTSGNVTEPSEGKKDEGWIIDDVPPSSYENWRTKLVGEWFKWLDERFFDGTDKNSFLIKSPGSAVSAVRVEDTKVTSLIEFNTSAGIVVAGHSAKHGVNASNSAGAGYAALYGLNASPTGYAVEANSTGGAALWAHNNGAANLQAIHARVTGGSGEAILAEITSTGTGYALKAVHENGGNAFYAKGGNKATGITAGSGTISYGGNNTSTGEGGSGGEFFGGDASANDGGAGLEAYAGNAGGAGVGGSGGRFFGGAPSGIGVEGAGSTTGQGGYFEGGDAGDGIYSEASASAKFGVHGTNTYASDNAGCGVYGYGEHCYGVIARGLTASPTRAAFRIVPQTSAPTGPNQIGDIYVDNNGKLYICTVAGTPGTWTVVGTQA